MGELARLGELSKERRSEWVDRLFARLSAMYGARFEDMWGGLDLAIVKAAWADDLADLTTDEVARGVDACRRAKFPPTLPEFFALCRPPLNAEQAFAEAVHQLALREQGRDAWSHPAVFWAAVTVGAFDLRNAAWATIKVRWSRLLEAELAKGEWPAIPPRLEALPAPGGQAADPERVGQVVRSAISRAKEAGSKAWAKKLGDEIEAGKVVPMAVRRDAEAVLGRRLVRKVDARRPDHADRAAGDRSFDDEAVVI